MSTNIRVDVTLQRLQEQSRQATEQNRRERQERDDALLAKQQQSEQTSADSKNQADKPAAQNTTSPNSRQTDSSRAKGKSPFGKRRPAAQRLGTPSIVGIHYRYDASPAPPGTSTSKITVGVPGLKFKVERVLPPYPTTTVNTNINLPPNVEEPPDGLNPGLATLGGIKPPTVFQPTGLSINYYWNQDIRLYDLSAPLCLPLNNNATIFVWDHHLVRHHIILAEEVRRESQSVDEQQDYDGNTFYNRLNDYTLTYTYDNDDFKVTREVVCFLVTPKGVREVATPAALLRAIQSRRPTATKTGLIEVVQGVTYQQKNSVLSSTDPNVTDTITIPEARTLQNLAGFQLTNWSRRYTGPGMGLAMQYGIGSLLDNTHGAAGRDYFSGSIYQWLTKPMDLSTEQSLNYGYVKKLISDFPGRYITRVAGFPANPPPTYRPELENFGIAKKAPLRYTGAPMNFDDFIWTSQYKFSANGAPTSELAYCWNWDDEQYCRRQLQALGFKNADFVL
jgi:hypothetical protein